jgi:putative FmdB family regulatory protein
MPVYTFKCKECGKTFDEFTHNYNLTTVICKCEKNSEAERTVASLSKPKFNGNGFYETDYKK